MAMRILPLFAVFLFSAVAVQAAPPFPGGLLDSTGRTVYVRSQTGIEALDLTRGDVVWRTSLASRPLLVVDDRLYALVVGPENRLRIRGFDLCCKGDKVFESAAVQLPRWVTPRNDRGHSFSCRWKRHEARLDLTWRASAAVPGGTTKESAGLASIDLESGKVQQCLIPPPRAPTSPLRPPQLEKLAVRWHRSSAGQLTALAVEELPGSVPGRRLQRLVLRNWNERTGKENQPRELLRGTRLVFMAGLDDRHLWLRDAAPCPDESNAPLSLAGRHWSVFAAVDGHLVARVPFLPGTHAATIIGDWAYCLTGGGVRAIGEAASRSGRVLHAINLTTGKVVWRHGGIAPAHDD
jgi:hypothetical protein